MIPRSRTLSQKTRWGKISATKHRSTFDNHLRLPSQINWVLIGLRSWLKARQPDRESIARHNWRTIVTAQSGGQWVYAWTSCAYSWWSKPWEESTIAPLYLLYRLMYRSGPRTEPWGTPKGAWTQADLEEPNVYTVRALREKGAKPLKWFISQTKRCRKTLEEDTVIYRIKRRADVEES